MKKTLLVAILALATTFTATARADESGLYVGADLGADTTLTGNYGFSYGANIGYRINSVIAIEGKYQSLPATMSNTTSLNSSSVTSTGTLVNVLFYSDPIGISKGFFKLGYGKLSSTLNGTRSSLVGGRVVTTSYSTPFDTNAIVLGFGEETKATSSPFGLRIGMDLYSQTSQTSGVSNPELVINAYFAGIYNF